MRKSPYDTRPERRSLRIYAFDPMLSRGGDLRITVDLPYREIKQTDYGFHDDRLEVIDYDGTARSYYRAINLKEPKIAMQQGVEPSESDPQFHQQMVYAVASRVLENFDRALGRRLRFWGGHPLRLIPHAFRGRNAYYDPKLNAVLFGYFAADEDDPGPNLPGQLVFTCLSQDIVAHEVTHAALDRLHRFYREPMSAQVLALHEAFADIVALFQRFTYTEVVREVIRTTHGDLLHVKNPLLDIGAQFGAAAGMGAALRQVGEAADATEFARTQEPHALGRILVSAVFEGFVRTFERRTTDLVRIATGGSWRLPEAEPHPDVVSRLTMECAKTAQSVMAMCIRATDYLPPVDPTFSDLLRAMVTADYELNRADDLGLRASMIEAFRIRGIRPQSVGSLAVESLLLDQIETGADPELAEIVRDLVNLGALDMSRTTSMRVPGPPLDELIARRISQATCSASIEQTETSDEADEPDTAWRAIGRRLGEWVARWISEEDNAREVGLDPGRKTQVAGWHPVHRIAPSGELVIEMIAQFVQSRPPEHDDLGGLTYRAGFTMIVTLDGRIRYLIAKPFHADRYHALVRWVAAFDADIGPAWPPAVRSPKRLLAAFGARAMELTRWR